MFANLKQCWCFQKNHKISKNGFNFFYNLIKYSHFKYISQIWKTYEFYKMFSISKFEHKFRKCSSFQILLKTLKIFVLKKLFIISKKMFPFPKIVHKLKNVHVFKQNQETFRKNRVSKIVQNFKKRSSFHKRIRKFNNCSCVKNYSFFKNVWNKRIKKVHYSTVGHYSKPCCYSGSLQLTDPCSSLFHAFATAAMCWPRKGVWLCIACLLDATGIL